MQSPFISAVLNLREAMTVQEQKDLAMIIEEVLKQRLQGVKNKDGRWISPLFPKLLYVLCDGLNVNEGDPYYYLTELAARCEVKRMQPDIISEKVCREAKEGMIIPSMGAARGDSIVSIKIEDVEYFNISIENAFKLIREYTKRNYLGNRGSLNEFKGVCGVYKITHIPTGKYYIGSSKDVRRRLTEHKYSIRHRGKLGEMYFINDYDVNNFEFKLITSCDIDNLWLEESKYIDLTDPRCVNYKDSKNNGNFTINNRLRALNGEKYSNIPYVEKSHTWFKKLDTNQIYVLSRGVWEPIRAITFNDSDSILAMYEVTLSNGTKLHITEDHPLVTERGRVQAMNLKVGDIVYDSRTLEKISVVKIKKTNEHTQSYDFEVANDMFDLDGILSHNCRSILTPYWRKRIYKQSINSSLIESGDKYNVELDSIRRFGLNSELLTKPNKDKICLSLKPISLVDMYVEDREFEDHTYLYNYLGNTGWITKIYRKDDYIYVETKEPKWYGRWNQGVVTLNIPYVALQSKTHNTDFFEELDKASEIVRHALRERHNSILTITAKNAPILWQYGALARLDSEDKLNSMLDEDVEYTTISYGYVGLYETCMCLLGKSNTTKEGQAFSIEILEHINNLLDKWKKEDKIPYSIYGTPEEQTTEKFARALKNNFVGVTVVGVNDHDYVTNSYHVNPAEPISAFDKLAIEGKFLNLSKGGAVSYIECSSALEKNTKAIETVFKFMYDNILYSELNFTNEDYCENCGYQGELILDNTNGGKFLFHCPHCGCKDATKLHATRRLCGYIGEVANGIGKDSPNANQGRLADIYSRVKHI